MRNLMLAAAVTLALVLPAAVDQARAGNEVDVATITCKELLASKKDDIGTILIWLHGYYGGKAEDTTFDPDAFGQGAEQMGAYCAEHPDVGVMSAAKAVFGE